MSIYFVVIAIAYLLGSIPFGYILVRVFRGEDVRKLGSGNIGATNVARSGAKALAIATLLMDAAKGYAAVVIAMVLTGGLPSQTGVTAGSVRDAQAALQALQSRAEHVYLAAALAAVFAIVGHVFPLWLRFKGGKGVATGVGAFAALAPAAVGIVLLIFVLVVALFRYVSLGSIVATAAFPVFAWLLYRYRASPAVLAATVACAALIIFKHKDNIRRLLAGTEHRLDLKPEAKA